MNDYETFCRWFDGEACPSHTDSSAHSIAWAAWRQALDGVRPDLDRLSSFEEWLICRAGPTLHIDAVREALQIS